MVPAWANPADAPTRNTPIENWNASLPKLPPPPTAVFASVHALAELDLLREPLSAAAHTVCERVRTLKSSGVFSCSEAGPSCVENEVSQAHVEERVSTPSNVRRLPRDNVRNGWRDEKTETQPGGAPDCSHTSCWSCDDPIIIAPSWFSAPPGVTLPMGSRPHHWRNEFIERHPGPKRPLPLRGWDVLVQDDLPTTVQRYDVAASESENNCLSGTSMGSKSSSITGLNELGHLCIQYLRTCSASGTLGPGQAGTLISGLRRYVLLARSCGADLEHHQSVFRTL